MYKKDKKSISELELEPELELELEFESEFELESDIKLESNSDYKNIKVNDTDIEVLEKKVSFFPPHLLNEKPKPKPKPIKNQVQPSLNYMKPKVQEQVLSRVIPQNMVIRPMAQMRGGGRRGIGMRMF